MPTWLEYRYEDTIFHRMNPLTKIALLIGLMSYTPIVWDPRILLVLGAIAIVMVYVAKVPRWWLFLLVFIILARGWSGFIFGLGVRPEQFRHLPLEIAGISAFEITLPGTELTYGITFGGLAWGLAITLQSPITVLFAYVFIYSTSLSDLIQALSKLRFIPQSLLYVIMVGYRFIPYMFRMTTDVIHAQQLRGWGITSKNPVKIFKQVQPIAYPIARQVLNIIDEVTISSQIRAFGSGKISAPARLNMKASDWIISILSILIMGTLLILLFWPGIWLGWL